MDVLTSLRRHLPPFLDSSDTVLGTVLSALAQGLGYGRSALDDAAQALQVLGASGDRLDDVARRLGIVRMPNETDAHLLQRIAAVVLPRVSPDAVVRQLGYLGFLPIGSTGDSVLVPSGNVLVGWDPSWAFHYDRQVVTPSFARASGATGPDGTSASTNEPTWYASAGGMTWAGVFGPTTQLLTNTNFGSVTSGLPTGWTASLLSGDTASVGAAPSGYPIQGDSVLTWSRASAAASGTTIFTSPAMSVSPNTAYALSVYLDARGLKGGSVALAVADAAKGTTTVLAQRGTTSGVVRFWGTYTTGSSATTIQLQLQFPAQLYGSVSFGSPMIEPGKAPTEYLRNSSTSGTASRSAATLTLPASVSPVWGQGVVAVSAWISPSTQAHTSYLLDSNWLSLVWNGSAWTATLADGTSPATVLTASGQIAEGEHLFVIRWSNVLGAADLWIDGVQLAQTALQAYPSSAGTLYMGSKADGSSQADAYLGNMTLLNAYLPDTIVKAWAVSARLPVLTPTMFTGAFEGKVLAGTTGSSQFGATYCAMLPVSGSILLSQNPFWLDTSYMDSGAALQGIPQPVPGTVDAIPSTVAAGVDVYSLLPNVRM